MSICTEKKKSNLLYTGLTQYASHLFILKNPIASIQPVNAKELGSSNFATTLYIEMLIINAWYQKSIYLD